MPIIDPSDKSTVFSIVPWPVFEFKPGLYPGVFKIDPCMDERQPKRLVVGSSVHYKYIPDQPKPDMIETLSYRVAEAIVNDFLDGQLYTTPDAKPGMCWARGVVPIEEFIKSMDFKLIREQQRQWFRLVVEQTTNDWKKYNSYKVVSDQARFAAHYLGLEPDWLKVQSVLEYIKCPACSTRNDPENAVCMQCSCILNRDKFATLQFASAAR